jgi:hypothetical protein
MLALVEPRDDFRVLDEHQHMFFGLSDPYGLLRSVVSDGLREQVPDTEVVSIRAHGEPSWLTAGVRHPEAPTHLVVTRFGLAVRASIHARSDALGLDQVLEAGITLLFARVNERGREQSRSFLDLHADAERTLERFEARFLAHGREHASER